ncbi:hypothetical protein TNCV_2287541 [Trichonephila clavipes]|nr:hypothetical protein TNCV_2287541 [Trichonephila clavipes]
MRISHKRLTIWKTTFAVIADIRPQMLEKSSKIGRQIGLHRASRGSPMPEIIFKIKMGGKRNSYTAHAPRPVFHALEEKLAA